MESISSIAEGLRQEGHTSLAKKLDKAVAGDAHQRANGLIRVLNSIGFKKFTLTDDSSSDILRVTYAVKNTPLHLLMRTKEVVIMTKAVVMAEADINITKNEIVFVITK